jgi:hypothetical protein
LRLCERSAIFTAMITSFDLPEEIVDQAQGVAAARKTTLQALVLEGLRVVLRESIAPVSSSAEAALERLRRGLHLGGGRPLSREDLHAR